MIVEAALAAVIAFAAVMALFTVITMVKAIADAGGTPAPVQKCYYCETLRDSPSANTRRTGPGGDPMCSMCQGTLRLPNEAMGSTDTLN